MTKQERLKLSAMKPFWKKHLMLAYITVTAVLPIFVLANSARGAIDGFLVGIQAWKSERNEVKHWLEYMRSPEE